MRKKASVFISALCTCELLFAEDTSLKMEEEERLLCLPAFTRGTRESVFVRRFLSKVPLGNKSFWKLKEKRPLHGDCRQRLPQKPFKPIRKLRFLAELKRLSFFSVSRIRVIERT